MSLPSSPSPLRNQIAFSNGIASPVHNARVKFPSDNSNIDNCNSNNIKPHQKSEINSGNLLKDSSTFGKQSHLNNHGFTAVNKEDPVKSPAGFHETSQQCNSQSKDLQHHLEPQSVDELKRDNSVMTDKTGFYVTPPLSNNRVVKSNAKDQNKPMSSPTRNGNNNNSHNLGARTQFFSNPATNLNNSLTTSELESPNHKYENSCSNGRKRPVVKSLSSPEVDIANGFSPYHQSVKSYSVDIDSSGEHEVNTMDEERDSINHKSPGKKPKDEIESCISSPTPQSPEPNDSGSPLYYDSDYISDDDNNSDCQPIKEEEEEIKEKSDDSEEIVKPTETIDKIETELEQNELALKESNISTASNSQNIQATPQAPSKKVSATPKIPQTPETKTEPNSSARSIPSGISLNSVEKYYVKGVGVPESPNFEDLKLLYGLGPPIERHLISPTMNTKASERIRQKLLSRLQAQKDRQEELASKARAPSSSSPPKVQVVEHASSRSHQGRKIATRSYPSQDEIRSSSEFQKGELEEQLKELVQDNESPEDPSLESLKVADSVNQLPLDSSPPLRRDSSISINHHSTVDFKAISTNDSDKDFLSRSSSNVVVLNRDGKPIPTQPVQTNNRNNSKRRVLTKMIARRRQQQQHHQEDLQQHPQEELQQPNDYHHSKRLSSLTSENERRYSRRLSSIAHSSKPVSAYEVTSRPGSSKFYRHPSGSIASMASPTVSYNSGYPSNEEEDISNTSYLLKRSREKISRLERENRDLRNKLLDVSSLVNIMGTQLAWTSRQSDILVSNIKMIANDLTRKATEITEDLIDEEPRDHVYSSKRSRIQRLSQAPPGIFAERFIPGADSGSAQSFSNTKKRTWKEYKELINDDEDSYEDNVNDFNNENNPYKYRYDEYPQIALPEEDYYDQSEDKNEHIDDNKIEISYSRISAPPHTRRKQLAGTSKSVTQYYHPVARSHTHQNKRRQKHSYYHQHHHQQYYSKPRPEYLEKSSVRNIITKHSEEENDNDDNDSDNDNEGEDEDEDRISDGDYILYEGKHSDKQRSPSFKYFYDGEVVTENEEKHNSDNGSDNDDDDNDNDNNNDNDDIYNDNDNEN